MASRFPTISSTEDSNSDSFLDISVLENKDSKHQKISFENVNPNQQADSTSIEEWEFLPSRYVPNSKALQQNTSSKLATLTNSKPSFSLKSKLRKRMTLPKLMNPKRSAPGSSFSTYDIVDPFEAPSTELVEQELTQCLLHESVVIDECPSDNEDDVMANSMHQCPLPAKRRGSVGESFLARSNVKWQRAVNSLKLTVEDDQQICGVWLLSEINHWDNESERIVMLLEDSVLIAKYVALSLAHNISITITVIFPEQVLTKLTCFFNHVFTNLKRFITNTIVMIGKSGKILPRFDPVS